MEYIKMEWKCVCKICDPEDKVEANRLSENIYDIRTQMFIPKYF